MSLRALFFICCIFLLDRVECKSKYGELGEQSTLEGAIEFFRLNKNLFTSKITTTQFAKSLVLIGDNLANRILTFNQILESYDDLFVGENEEVDEIKEYVIEKIQEISKHLDRVVGKIFDLPKTIEDEEVLNYYIEQYQTLVNVREAIKVFLTVRTKIAFEEVKKVCEKNKMFEYMKYLQFAITNSAHGGRLLKAMTRPRKRPIFQNMTANIITSYNEAILRYSECFHIEMRRHPEEERNETLLKNLLTITQMYQSIVHKLEAEDKKFEENFKDWAKDDIQEFMRDNKHMRNDAFATQLYKMLAEDYYWMDWFVFCIASEGEDSSYYLDSTQIRVAIEIKDYGRHVVAIKVSTLEEGKYPNRWEQHVKDKIRLGSHHYVPTGMTTPLKSTYKVVHDVDIGMGVITVRSDLPRARFGVAHGHRGDIDRVTLFHHYYFTNVVLNQKTKPNEKRDGCTEIDVYITKSNF